MGPRPAYQEVTVIVNDIGTRGGLRNIGAELIGRRTFHARKKRKGMREEREESWWHCFCRRHKLT